VFASVQVAFAAMDPAGLAPATFDVVIVDEFTNDRPPPATSAGWPTWRASLLLGLTALPERSRRARHPPIVFGGAHRPPNYGSRASTTAPTSRQDPNGAATGYARGAHQPLHPPTSSPPAPESCGELRRGKNHQLHNDAGHWMPWLLRERGARRLDGPQVPRCGLRAASLDASSSYRDERGEGRSAASGPGELQVPLSRWICSTKGSTIPEIGPVCSSAAHRERGSCSCSSSARGLTPLPWQELLTVLDFIARRACAASASDLRYRALLGAAPRT